MATTKTAIDASRRVILKIGSALVVEGGVIRERWLASLVEDVLGLRASGKQIAIVTSGAIAMGRKALGIPATQASSSISLELKQAAAAVGQIALYRAYHLGFERHGVAIGQVLLTPADTENRRPHLNARATLLKLLEKDVIPVINENDTVSTAEIRFGDNDRLAARVAQMIDADLLIQLSTTDGLYTADPRVDPKATHIPLVESLSAELMEMAGDALPGVSTGGMKSKMEAARIAVGAGTSMIIAKGTQDHALQALINGARATLFMAAGQPGSARKRWILAHVKPKGAYVVDDGAAKALSGGKSLLPSGVVAVEGTFDRADAVTITDKAGKRLAVGLTAYSGEDARRIIGHKSADIEKILGFAGRDELIHRDDLVLQA